MSDRPAPVPMCDVNAQYRALKPEIDAAVARVLASGLAINGPDVAAFEKETAEYCGAKHAIGCANGTDAILLALAALDIGPGDEVILPPFTFFATLGSVLRCGATPVFADIEPDGFNIDPKEVAKKVSARTKAVIPVHLFGQCADLDPIQALADRHGFAVIEDAAQSFGAVYRGRRCGGFGAINCFSFYPSKNLGTLGDAGLVTTNDDRLAKTLLAYRNHGSEVKYYHKYVGWNARLDTLHAAILRAKLPRVDEWIAGRRDAAARYDRLIDGSGLDGFFRRPASLPNRLHTFNQYTVRVAADRRDELVKHLRDGGVSCDVYYPLGLHRQECVRHLGHREGEFPIAEEACRTVVSLPIFPEITAEQQRRVIDRCAGFAAKGQALRRAA